MASNLRKLLSVARASSIQSLRESMKRRIIEVPIPAALAATTTIVAMALPIACKIVGVDVVFVSTQAFNGTNFWSVHLRDLTLSADVFTAAASTIKNNAADWTANVLYSHEIAPASQPILADQTVIGLVLTKNAAAANTVQGVARIFIEEA